MATSKSLRFFNNFFSYLHRICSRRNILQVYFLNTKICGWFIFCRVTITNRVNKVLVKWTAGFFITRFDEEKVRSAPPGVIFGEFFGNAALFVGLLAIAGLLLWFVIRWRRPQLKTIYDLEKGRYFTTASRGRWFRGWDVFLHPHWCILCTLNWVSWSPLIPMTSHAGGFERLNQFFYLYYYLYMDQLLSYEDEESTISNLLQWTGVDLSRVGLSNRSPWPISLSISWLTNPLKSGSQTTKWEFQSSCLAERHRAGTRRSKPRTFS